MRVLDEGAGEDVAPAEGAFGVSVFAGLGGADFQNLAWVRFQHCVAVLAEGRGLRGEGKGGVGVAACLRGEELVVICHETSR